MKIAEAIAKRIKELLVEKNITQYRLAKKMLIYQQSLSNIMNARQNAANVKTIFQLCKAFEISILEFFDSPLFIGNQQLDVD